jgi:hypothetical protein
VCDKALLGRPVETRKKGQEPRFGWRCRELFRRAMRVPVGQRGGEGVRRRVGVPSASQIGGVAEFRWGRRRSWRECRKSAGGDLKL